MGGKEREEYLWIFALKKSILYTYYYVIVNAKIMVHVHLTPSLTLYADRFRLGHVPGSLNLPKQHAFQPDGSLTPSPSSSNLSSVRSSRVVIVVANKGESGPVVGSVHIQSGVGNKCIYVEYGGHCFLSLKLHH